MTTTHIHQWENYVHTESLLVRKGIKHHCKLCADCGTLMCAVSREDYHDRLVVQLGAILDEASIEYDDDEGEVADFTQYVLDWARRRAEAPSQFV